MHKLTYVFRTLICNREHACLLQQKTTGVCGIPAYNLQAGGKSLRPRNSLPCKVAELTQRRNLMTMKYFNRLSDKLCV